MPLVGTFMGFQKIVIHIGRFPQCFRDIDEKLKVWAIKFCFNPLLPDGTSTKKL